MDRRGLLSASGLTEPQPQMAQGFGDLMPGHYWIRHPEGTRFVGLYQPPCWYAPGREKAIPVKPDMLIGPALPPDVAEQLQPLTESCMKLAGVILTMDEIIGPILATFDALSRDLVVPEKHEHFKRKYAAYKAVLNDAFTGTVVEMTTDEMVQGAAKVMSMQKAEEKSVSPETGGA